MLEVCRKMFEQFFLEQQLTEFALIHDLAEQTGRARHCSTDGVTLRDHVIFLRPVQGHVSKCLGTDELHDPATQMLDVPIEQAGRIAGDFRLTGASAWRFEQLQQIAVISVTNRAM